MRKRVFGRQFKRDKNERKALFKGLISSLIIHGYIKTTHAKAKAIKGEAEKIVTKIKKNRKNIPALVGQHVTPHAMKKLIDDIAPRFNNRLGGYTRIVKLGSRISDNAAMALLEWTQGPVSIEKRSLKIENGDIKEENSNQKKVLKIQTKTVKRVIKKK